MIVNVVGHQTVNVSVGTSSPRSNIRCGLQIILKDETGKPLNNKSLSPHTCVYGGYHYSQKLRGVLQSVCDGKNDLGAISWLHLKRSWAQPLRKACRFLVVDNSSNRPRLRAYLSIFSPFNRHSNPIKTRSW